MEKVTQKERDRESELAKEISRKETQRGTHKRWKEGTVSLVTRPSSY